MSIQSCVEKLKFVTIKHPNYLFMNEKILKEIKKVSFTRSQKNTYKSSDGEVNISSDSNIKAHQTYSTIESITLSLLKKWILSIVNENNNFDYKITSYWMAFYNKGDYAISHQHSPASLAFVYFINCPVGSSPLVFSTSNTIIEPEDGKLIIFPGNLNHHVPKNECDGRLVFSGNLSPIIGEDYSK